MINRILLSTTLFMVLLLEACPVGAQHFLSFNLAPEYTTGHLFTDDLIFRSWSSDRDFSGNLRGQISWTRYFREPVALQLGLQYSRRTLRKRYIYTNSDRSIYVSERRIDHNLAVNFSLIVQEPSAKNSAYCKMSLALGKDLGGELQHDTVYFARTSSVELPHPGLFTCTYTHAFGVGGYTGQYHWRSGLYIDFGLGFRRKERTVFQSHLGLEVEFDIFKIKPANTI